MLDPKPTRRIKRKEQRLDRVAAGRFKTVSACHLCGLLATESHHIVPQQTIRKAGLGEDVRWDVRGRLLLCDDCHRRHHSRKRPILLSELPLSALEFASEHGFDLGRWYPPGLTT